MKTFNFFFYMLILLLTWSCMPEVPESVSSELAKMTEANRKKYEKVFRHYRSEKDSLKLKSAFFLVENINDFGFHYGKQIDNFNKIFDVLADKPTDYRVNLPWYANEINYIFDSLEQRYGPLHPSMLKYARDVDVMTADYMITHIEQAFKAWNNPWSQHVSFENFCEYILPYRNFSEPIENWRPDFIEEFSWINDSIDDNTPMMRVAQILNYDTELKYSRGFDRYITSIPPSRLLQAKYGNCADNSNYKAMIMRAFGIPVSVDYLPQYGTDHNIHYWNAIMKDNHQFVSFWDTLNDINAMVAYKYTIAKVYRRTFSKNREMILLNQRSGDNTPPVFRNTRLLDVTREYVAVSEYNLDLSFLPNPPGYAYLAVFNDAGWSPISYAAVSNDQVAGFKDLGREVVYLPVIVKDRKYLPIASPFKIEADGSIIPLLATERKEAVNLTRKYHFHRRKQNWLKCLVGGRFEAANKADFSDAKTMAVISNTPSEHPNTISIKDNNEYRYFRFVFSPDELGLPYDGDGASIAEISCYNADGEQINGIPMGSEGRKYNPYTPEKCYDGNSLSFFEDARNQATLKYVGLAFDQPRIIKQIRYIPRNDLNTIQIGDTYELYFWDQGQFTSLGKKVATDTVLTYSDVPQNALLWLRNLSGGKEERIFTWENNKQKWW